MLPSNIIMGEAKGYTHFPYMIKRLLPPPSGIAMGSSFTGASHRYSGPQFPHLSRPVRL